MKYKMTPMPFKIGNQTYGSYSLYVPGDVHSYRFGMERIGPCTLACAQFIGYSTDNKGMRVIPNDAVCPHVIQNGAPAPCRGACVCRNGRVTDDTVYKRNGVKYMPRLQYGFYKSR